MAVCRVDPIIDQRWQALIERHRDAGIFHTSGWLEALRRTYGYEPVAYAIERGQELVNGIPFCRIRSWFTGRRLVSLPFSDHCQPLVESYLELKELLSAVQEDAAEQRCKYFEIRPLILEEPQVPAEAKVTKNSGALIHRLDLRPSQEDIFRGFHKQVVRKIARSERERVSYEEGRSEELLSKFYRLLLLTRRRHQLPPQPLVWFRNLIDCLGPRLKIRVASKDDTPIASIITLSFKGVVTYKYGCSDASFNPLGRFSRANARISSGRFLFGLIPPTYKIKSPVPPGSSSLRNMGEARVARATTAARFVLVGSTWRAQTARPSPSSGSLLCAVASTSRNSSTGAGSSISASRSIIRAA